MALIPPSFMNSVVAVGNRESDGTSRWVGSGFFYGRKLADLPDGGTRFRTYLVTNKHVRDGLTNPIVRANPQGAAPATVHPVDLISGHDGTPMWFGHPDPEIDVVVAGISLEPLRARGYEVEFIQAGNAATVGRMRDEGFSEGDDMFLIGFPLGNIGVTRSAAIVRRATLARFASLRDGYEKYMLIDGAAYPGNSGGPVFSKPELVAIGGTQDHPSAYLVGVVAAFSTYQDIAVSQQTGRARIIFEENTGLSHVFPVDAIESAIDVYEAAHPLDAPSSAATEDAEEVGPSTAEPSMDS